MTLKLANNRAYRSWLLSIKEKIRLAQIKAAIKVNTELLNLYWELGKEIAAKQQQSSWGDALIGQMAEDLASEFPEIKGFSRTNLFYIRKWFLFYQHATIKVPQVVGQIQTLRLKSSKVPQVVGLIPTSSLKSSKVPQVVGLIPWGHNREIISKCTNINEALFYVQETVRNNWSRNVLLAQMESKLYKRRGKVLNNFNATLPKPQADLAIETLKNPYNFDFLSLGTKIQEKDLEEALTNQILKFLLELGQGFAFLGKQYPMVIGKKDHRIDLLFYHTQLRCYIVIELKVKALEPEFVGKLNYYLNAVNAQLKQKNDHPSIGILLCKTANKVVAEYSLKNIGNPLGVSEYKLINSIPLELKDELPTVKQLKAQLRTVKSRRP